MLVLGIETSCDETSVGIVRDGKEILSNVVRSQVDIHKIYKGVVPEIASRKHLELIDAVLEEALREANVSIYDIDLIAVTNGPGLIPALLVGLTTAKTLHLLLEKPMVPVNHIKAHLYAPFLEGNTLDFPYIGLIVSGGHTALFLVKSFVDMDFVGSTLDDAIGEAFDKVARLIGLEYPGGPAIDKLSQYGDPYRFDFPIPILDWDKNRYNFSYSGLKTAILYTIRKIGELSEKDKADISASFQRVAIEALVQKVLRLVKDTGIYKVVIAGGVAANSYLRKRFKEISEEYNLKVIIPSLKLCLDNGAMVAGLGYHLYKSGIVGDIHTDVFARDWFIPRGGRVSL